MAKVLIIGAGLSGLSSAYALRSAKAEVEILEARSRLGGRIFTKQAEACHLELGATWFGPQHTSLLELVKALNVPYKVQDNGSEAIYDFRPDGNLERFQIPAHGASTYKFEHGTSSLIEALSQNISAKIHFDEAVKSISYDDTFLVKTTTGAYRADYVLMSIPVQLMIDSVSFSPELPLAYKNLFSNTHTWMSDSIKFSVGFSSAFWKNNRFVGTLMSPKQIIQEMYDHSTKDQTQQALVGFLNSAYASFSESERQTAVLDQLQGIFPSKALKALAYADVNWRKENFTIHETAQALAPHQNNGHPNLRDGFFEDKLFFTASETAAQTPGYMDGAVHRGLQAGKLILNKLS